MRRLLAAGLAVLVLGTVGTACATGTPTGPASGAPTSPAPAILVSTSPQLSDRAAILAAVLRRYLTTPGENSFPGIGFAHVYVIERTDTRAGDPMATMPWGTGPELTALEQAALAEAMRDVGPVRFVASENDVLQSRSGCASVTDGILMLLGEPVGNPDRVEVGVMGFVACTGATWLRYVVQPAGGAWHVTGTTGGTAIA